LPLQWVRVPVDSRPALDHHVQGPSALWDRGPGIGRPGLDPVPKIAVVEMGPMALPEPPAPLHVDHHAEDSAIAVPGAGRIAARIAPFTLKDCHPNQLPRPLTFDG